jgi:pimeloyl-ACP methyl ester carboxylesterase
MESAIRYAKSGEVSIAYQVVGDGPLDLVWVPGWTSNLELMWEEPSYARFLRRLASFSRVILLDKRGTGLSDRVPTTELPTLEQRMDDVRAVMDRVGSDRAALFGTSEGGPLCALFAATHSERTTALVMYGTIGLQVRAGLHTGECEQVGDDIGGIAVHIGARVAAQAGAGEILVSSTVKDLVAGAGIAFADQGEHALKGVPGTWRLFSVVP